MHIVPADISRAIDNSEFSFAYQPILDTRTAKPIGFEALIRWKHPDYGLLMPDSFLHQLETSGSIARIDYHAIDAGCLKARSWLSAGYADFHINVNVSARSIAERDFVDNFYKTIRSAGIDPCHLRLEVTEHSEIPDVAFARTNALALRAAGVKLCLDDFNTGFSLRHLNTLRFDCVKLDRGLLKSIRTNTRRCLQVKSLVEAFHADGVDVVAEGIETESDAQLVRELHCDGGQGFFYDHPASYRSGEPYSGFGAAALEQRTSPTPRRQLRGCAA